MPQPALRQPGGEPGGGGGMRRGCALWHPPRLFDTDLGQGVKRDPRSRATGKLFNSSRRKGGQPSLRLAVSRGYLRMDVIIQDLGHEIGESTDSPALWNLGSGMGMIWMFLEFGAFGFWASLVSSCGRLWGKALNFILIVFSRIPY